METGAGQSLCERFISADDIDKIPNEFEHIEIFSIGEFGYVSEKCLET